MLLIRSRAQGVWWERHLRGKAFPEARRNGYLVNGCYSHVTKLYCVRDQGTEEGGKGQE